MLNIATAIGLGSSRPSIRLLAPIVCRRYASKPPNPPRTVAPKSQPSLKPPVRSTPSTSSAKLSKPATTGKPVVSPSTKPTASSLPKTKTAPTSSSSKPLISPKDAGSPNPNASASSAKNSASTSSSSRTALSSSPKSVASTTLPKTSASVPSSKLTATSSSDSAPTKTPSTPLKPSTKTPRTLNKAITGPAGPSKVPPSLNKPSVGPSKTPPPSVNNTSAGPSKTPPPTWTKSTASSSSNPSSIPPSTTSNAPSFSLSTPSPTPPPRSTPAPALQPTSTTSTTLYRDPSKPRVPQRFDWPWEEMDSEDPEYIVEQRTVYARPTVGNTWSRYQHAAGFSVSFLMTTLYAFIVLNTTIPAPPERETASSYTGKVTQFLETTSHNIATSPWTFPILSLMSLFCIWSIKSEHLHPVKRIIQTRSRFRMPLKDETGRLLPGQETLSTYLVTRNMDGLPQWFRNVSGVKEYREIDPADISIRRHWNGLVLLLNVHGKSREPWSFNKDIVIRMDPPRQELVDLANESGQALVLSESRLKGVFGDFGPVRDGVVGKVVNSLRSKS